MRTKEFKGARLAVEDCECCLGMKTDSVNSVKMIRTQGILAYQKKELILDGTQEIRIIAAGIDNWL